MLRIAIVGNGRMGKAVAELATAPGHTIETIIESAENTKGQALTRARLGLADVAIEFTRPDVVVHNLERLIEVGVPTVTGTTGWAGSLPGIVERVKRAGGALLY